MNKCITLFSSVIFLTLSGCEDKNVVPITGEIVGFINLLNESGTEMEDKAGVRIVVDETHSTETDDRGYFEIKDVRPGTYRIVFEKDGFGTVKRFNFNFAAGNVPAVVSDITLVELPSLELRSHTILQQGTSVRVSGTIAESDRYHFVYYFGNEADVSNVNFEYSFRREGCCGPMITFAHDVWIPLEVIGPTYMVGYAVSTANRDGAYSYYDPEIAETINPAVKKLFDPIRVR